VRAFQHADHARFAHPRRDLDPQIAQRARDDAGGTHFLKGRLRVAVKVAAALDQFFAERFGLRHPIYRHNIWTPETECRL
jgi:hypothetical protein